MAHPAEAPWPAGPTRTADVAVIGAGLAGLAVAAGFAREGVRAVVLEKSRGTGGRLATRRAGGLRFDHGAQYLRPRDPGFAAALAGLAEAAAAAIWPAPGADPAPAHVGLPGMSGLVKPLAAGLDLRLGVTVARAAREQAAWVLRDAGGQEILRAPRLVCTTPAPQAAGLLAGDPMADALTDVEMVPNWTLMAAFDAPPDLPEILAEPEADLAWIARDGGKPGRGDAQTWVAQAGAAWSHAHLEHDREAVAALLLAALAARAGGALPTPVYLSAHRWRYAQASRPLGKPCLADPGRGLVIAGDWCLGTKAEDAWCSAGAALDALRRPACG